MDALLKKIQKKSTCHPAYELFKKYDLAAIANEVGLRVGHFRHIMTGHASTSQERMQRIEALADRIRAAESREAING